MTGAGVLWGLLGLTGLTLLALAGLVLLAPQWPSAEHEARLDLAGTAPRGPLTTAATDRGSGDQSGAQTVSAPPDDPASAAPPSKEQPSLEAESIGQGGAVTPAPGTAVSNPSAAFEDAPGVLSVSLRTRRKEALKAYPTEFLGAIALGLEDLRLAPSHREGRLEVNLGELIRYEQKEHEVPKASRRLLDGIGRLLAENPDTRVEILSHTDDEGEAGFNLRLSQRRADAIQAYLVGRGVERERIRAQGRGEESPLVDTSRRTPTRAERAKNRRTELVIEPLESAGPAPLDGEAPGAPPPTTVTAAQEPARD